MDPTVEFSLFRKRDNHVRYERLEKQSCGGDKLVSYLGQKEQPCPGQGDMPQQKEILSLFSIYYLVSKMKWIV